MKTESGVRARSDNPRSRGPAPDFRRVQLPPSGKRRPRPARHHQHFIDRGWAAVHADFRHIARVSRRAAPDTRARPPLFWHALVPFTFRIAVSHQTQGPSSESLPAAPGIQQGASRRIRSTPSPSPASDRGDRRSARSTGPQPRENAEQAPPRVGAPQPDRFARVTRCPSQPRTLPPSIGGFVAPTSHIGTRPGSLVSARCTTPRRCARSTLTDPKRVFWYGFDPAASRVL